MAAILKNKTIELVLGDSAVEIKKVAPNGVVITFPDYLKLLNELKVLQAFYLKHKGGE